MRSIKIVFVSVALVLCSSVAGFAQSESVWFKRGYRGNVEFDAGATLSRTFIVSVLTSHGYSVGNGLYLGVGTGVTINPNDRGYFVLPIFADMKYSFMDCACSPFLSMKMGTSFYMESVTAGFLLKPSVGVDVGNFSLHIGYGLHTGTEVIDVLQSEDYIKHSLAVGASWWF